MAHTRNPVATPNRWNPYISSGRLEEPSRSTGMTRDHEPSTEIHSYAKQSCEEFDPELNEDEYQAYREALEEDCTG